MCRPKDFLELWKQCKDAFLQFEGITGDMLTCPAEDLPDKVQERQKLIEKIDAIQAQWHVYREDAQMGNWYAAVLDRTHDRPELPESLRPAYDLSTQARSSHSRINDLEIQAALRLRTEQEMILEKIKENNRGSGAQAVRFYAVGRNAPGEIQSAIGKA